MGDNKNNYEFLIGKRINDLTVIGLSKNKDSRIMCVCKCVCGKEVKIRPARIVNNDVTSCGCKRNDSQNEYRSMIGKKINKWEIIGFEFNKISYFVCRCECGNVKKVNVYNLLKKYTKDCGCGRKRMLSETKSKNLLGQKFGKLLVVERIQGSSKFKRIRYRCKCDCGNETIVESCSLVTGTTISCGCIISKHNLEIKTYLTELNLEHVPEYVVKIDGHYMRYDFYIPSKNLIIEYDGEHHYRPVAFAGKSYYNAESNFERTQRYDQLKNQYCTDNGINLLRIPYWEQKNIKAIINTCLQRLSEKGVA